MRGVLGAAPTFTPTNFGSQALFNNSPGQYLLRVWAILDRDANIMGVSIRNSRLITHDVGVITPAVTGEPTPPGTIDQQDLNPAPAYNFVITSNLTPPGILNPTIPLVVLRPGWSVVVTGLTAASAMSVAWWWDYVLPVELQKADIGDPQIDG